MKDNENFCNDNIKGFIGYLEEYSTKWITCQKKFNLNAEKELNKMSISTETAIGF